MASGGIGFILSVDDEGCVWAFGDNLCGQLGLGNDENGREDIPRKISELCNIQSVSCGRSFSLCVSVDGNVWGFGDNSYGQLGVGKIFGDKVAHPVCIENIPFIISVHCGYNHSFCISDTHTVFGFGCNKYNQLGIGGSNSKSKPVLLKKTKNIINISCGREYSVFLSSAGEVYMCGTSRNGEFGSGKVGNEIWQFPKRNSLLKNISQISCGENHTMVLTDSGELFAFGLNSNGQLGIEVSQPHYKPIKVNISNISTFNCACNSTRILLKSGELMYCGEKYWWTLMDYTGRRDESLQLSILVENISTFSLNGNQFLVRSKNGDLLFVKYNSGIPCTNMNEYSHIMALPISRNMAKVKSARK